MPASYLLSLRPSRAALCVLLCAVSNNTQLCFIITLLLLRLEIQTNTNKRRDECFTLTRRVQRPRGCSSQLWTVISVQFFSPAVEASLGRVSSSSDTVPDGDSRLRERSPRHAALMSTLTWGGIKEGRQGVREKIGGTEPGSWCTETNKPSSRPYLQQHMRPLGRDQTAFC